VGQFKGATERCVKWSVNCGTRATVRCVKWSIKLFEMCQIVGQEQLQGVGNVVSNSVPV